MFQFYHITLAKNVASLFTNGADPLRIGVNSFASGPGFHLTPKYTWAEEWGRILFPHPLDQTTILQVTLDDTARFAIVRQRPAQDVLEQWCKAQGYLEKDGSLSGKLLQVAHEENWSEDNDSFLDAMEGGGYRALMGVYLAAQGFDGYWMDNDLVVTNFSLLVPGAFVIATGLHRQMATIQDAETGHFITLRLSSDANGLMVSCYRGDQSSGSPMASLQVVSSCDQLEVRYWDATMSDGQDPRRLVLVEHIPTQSQGDDQPPEDRLS